MINIDKIVVVEGVNVVGYDMTLKEWQIKIVQPSPVAAIAFNSSGNILFVADGAGIHVSLIKGPDLDRPKVTKRALSCSLQIYFLETAHHFSTIANHAITTGLPIQTLDVGLYQVLIINGSVFMKMNVKCDI
jgi:hypothetical protein